MEFDSPYVNLRIKNKILVGTYKKNLRINLEVAKAIVRARISFTGKKSMPSLIMSQGVVTIDKPARDYLSSTEATEGLTASAIIVNSTFSYLMSNFFIVVNKTSMPVKMFSSTAKAEKWLEQFIK